MHKIHVDNCMNIATDNLIKIISQDGDRISFSVTQDCKSEWLATDFMALGNNLICQQTRNCRMPNEYISMCVDGVAIVDLYAYGDSYGQTDGLPLVIPKACDRSASGYSLCHFRYLLKCYPSRCAEIRNEAGRLRGSQSILSS